MYPGKVTGESYSGSPSAENMLTDVMIYPICNVNRLWKGQKKEKYDGTEHRDRDRDLN